MSLTGQSISRLLPTPFVALACRSPECSWIVTQIGFLLAAEFFFRHEMVHRYSWHHVHCFLIFVFLFFLCAQFLPPVLAQYEHHALKSIVRPCVLLSLLLGNSRWCRQALRFSVLPIMFVLLCCFLHVVTAYLNFLLFFRVGLSFCLGLEPSVGSSPLQDRKLLLLLDSSLLATPEMFHFPKPRPCLPTA